jgi:hypothetical protein
MSNHRRNLSYSYRGRGKPALDDSPVLDWKMAKTRHQMTHVRGLMPRSIPSINYVHFLCIAAVFVLYYGERSYPYNAISKCNWHPVPIESRAKVALIADPQLVDDNTYPKRNKMLLKLTKYIVDAYLRRNWIYLNEILDPDANIFLGDYFDGGREWDDSTWHQEFHRWNAIFTKPPFKRTIMSLPGNHDIGYGDTVVPEALSRFRAFFGEPSSTVEIAQHTFVLLDTISMTNTLNSTVYGPPKQFMDSLAVAVEKMPERPRFLLTHVPLYRPPDSFCGKHRESSHKALPYMYGYQYQTLINPGVSHEILSTIKPVAVFSGDDHDACHVQHNYVDGGVQRQADEFTVKSFSMAMGIDRPGIELVTLDSSKAFQDPVGSYHTSICLMPSPFLPFIVYGIFGLTALTVMVMFAFFPDRLPRYLRTLAKKRSTDSGYTSLPVYSGETTKKSKLKRGGWMELRNGCLVVGLTFLSIFLYLNHTLFD